MPENRDAMELLRRVVRNSAGECRICDARRGCYHADNCPAIELEQSIRDLQAEHDRLASERLKAWDTCRQSEDDLNRQLTAVEAERDRLREREARLVAALKARIPTCDYFVGEEELNKCDKFAPWYEPGYEGDDWRACEQHHGTHTPIRDEAVDRDIALLAELRERDGTIRAKDEQ